MDDLPMALPQLIWSLNALDVYWGWMDFDLMANPSLSTREGKGALNPLLLPIFAITGVLPGHKWNTTQYRQNTMQYTSEIQLPLINAASLSQWAKSALAWGLEEEKTFCTQRRFCLPRTSSFSFQMSAGRNFICTENMLGLKVFHTYLSFPSRSDSI